jgi:eukaryotic-like serine/threonine-protein kinase
MITPKNANYVNSGLGRTIEVGTYPANPWGLFDMHGNVCEWVEDEWHDDYQGAPSDGSAWKHVGAARSPRDCVLRGGSWGLDPGDCRSACRLSADSRGWDGVGFRVARTLSLIPEKARSRLAPSDRR